ncbi:hypothetical protein [Bacillus alkalicellulosilyticus]|uniref:hypothetical protein n=1 Tax=Alkalihalobacterium alkalicellulosilyticum TaxID=1912214 RepID=UPI000997CBDC|nr:hypothetical protein [Bacillus alkalicellulosilyticus]
MIIKHAEGYELEKEKPNTSEDFFNRSKVVYHEDGKDKEFYVLYVRYFDEKIKEMDQFQNEPLFSIDGKDVSFKDIVALACLLTNPNFKKKKRIYINEIEEFEQYFINLELQVVKDLFTQLYQKGECKLTHPFQLTS